MLPAYQYSSFMYAIVFLALLSQSVQALQPSCPSGGNWFTCTSGSNFIGCCTSDPCNGGCSKRDIRAASYNTTNQDAFSDQRCSAGSAFYTCAETNPPFLGCCKSNPCSAGKCPTSDLTAAFLSKNATKAADFTASLLSSPTSTSSTATPTVSATSSPSTSAAVVQTGSKLPVSTGALVGIIAGGIVLLLAVSAVVVALCQRRSRPSKKDRNYVPGDERVMKSTRSSSESAHSTRIISTEESFHSPSCQYSALPTAFASPSLSINTRDSAHLQGSTQHIPRSEDQSSAPRNCAELEGFNSQEYASTQHLNQPVTYHATQFHHPSQYTQYVPYRPV